MGERLTLERNELRIAAKQVVGTALELLPQNQPDSTEPQTVTLLSSDTIVKITKRSQAQDITFESIPLNDIPGKLTTTSFLLAGNEIKNIWHLRVREFQGEEITKRLNLLQEAITHSKPVPNEEFTAKQREIFTHPYISSDMGAPLRAAGKRIVDSTTAKLRRLNPLRA